MERRIRRSWRNAFTSSWTLAGLIAMSATSMIVPAALADICDGCSVWYQQYPGGPILGVVCEPGYRCYWDSYQDMWRCVDCSPPPPIE